MNRPALILIVLAYAAFVSLGLPDTVLGVAWPSIRGAFGVSQAGLGAVLGVGVAGYFVSGLIAGRLLKKSGMGQLLAASTGLVALGLVGYATAPTWARFVPIAAVIGLGSGAIDAALNNWASSHLAVRHLNWLHACWGLGATLGPAIMTAVLVRGASFRVGYALIAAVLAAMALAFTATRRLWEDGGAVQRGAERDLAGEANRSRTQAGALDVLLRGRVLLQIAIFFVYTGVEGSAGQWCFTVMREARGMSVEAAGSWTSAYWGSLLGGRVALGMIIDRFGPDRLLRIAAFTAVLGALGFATLSGVPGRFGLVLLGASLAPFYPTLMARTPSRLGTDAAPHAIGFQVSAATLGAAALPGSVGLLVARFGPHAIPAAVVGGTALLLAAHEVLLRATRRPSPAAPRQPR